MEDELSFLIEVLNKNNEKRKNSSSNLENKFKPVKKIEIIETNNENFDKYEKSDDLYNLDMPKLNNLIMYDIKGQRKESGKKYFSINNLFDLNKIGNKFNNILLPVIKHQTSNELTKIMSNKLPLFINQDDEKQKKNEKRGYSQMHDKILYNLIFILIFKLGYYLFINS